MEETLMIEPPRPMSGTAVWMPMKGPVKLTRSTVSHSPALALLFTTVRRPRSSAQSGDACRARTLRFGLSGKATRDIARAMILSPDRCSTVIDMRGRYPIKWASELVPLRRSLPRRHVDCEAVADVDAFQALVRVPDVIDFHSGRPALR
jgi:hypothetical protein